MSCSLEMEEIGLLLKETPKDNKLLLCKISMLAEKLGTNAECVLLKLTKAILLEDPSNENVWSHRKSVLDQSLCGWEEEELDLCDQLIQANKFKGSDECAWDQRYFVVGKLDARVKLKAEARYAKKVILETPENKHAWAYLRCMYTQCIVEEEKSKFKDELLDDMFMTVFGAKDGGLENYRGIFKTPHLHELQMDIIKNKTKLINALEALMDLLCVGYLPTLKLVEALKLLNPSTEEVGFLEAIGNVLEFASPVGVRFWRMRVEQTRTLSQMSSY